MPELTKERLPQTGEDTRSAPAVFRKRSRGIPAERQVVHRGDLVSKVRHYPTADQKNRGEGVHEDFPSNKNIGSSKMKS